MKFLVKNIINSFISTTRGTLIQNCISLLFYGPFEHNYKFFSYLHKVNLVIIIIKLISILFYCPDGSSCRPTYVIMCNK
uniref:Uncharacterized protein n=1 Tax=Pararge aegeria TaxID=116150 RepID=S4NRA0_9NEOP